MVLLENSLESTANKVAAVKRTVKPLAGGQLDGGELMNVRAACPFELV